LGVTLYECLTLALPGSKDRCPDPSQSPPPIDPHQHNAAVGGELRVVLETAMAIEPGHRYATALAFAEDLRRLCEFEPIMARPASSWLRLRRFCRRNRRALAVGAVALVLVSVVLAVVVSEQLAARIHGAQQEAVQARTSARVDPQRALGTALAAWTRSPDDFANTTAIEALAQDQLVWELDCRPVIDARPGVRILDSKPTTNSRHIGFQTVFAAAEDRICVATTRYTATVAQLATGAVISDCEGDGELSSVAAGADGAFFAVWRSGEVRRWDPARGFHAWTCDAPALVGRHILSLTPAPGPGRRVLLLTREHDLVLWDEDQQTQVFAARHPAPVDSNDQLTAVFSSDGAWLVTGFGRPFDSGGTLFPERGDPAIWNVRTGALHWAVPSHGGRINCFDFAADGKSLAVAHEDGIVGIFDIEARRPVAVRTFRGEAFQIRFHPDGAHVVVCFAGGRGDIDPALAATPIRVLDRTDGTDVVATSGHQMRGVMAMAFSPDGRWFASAGNDRRIVIRSAADLAGEPERILSATYGLSTFLQWSSDGCHLVCIDGIGVACWNVQQAAVVVLRHDQPVCAVKFDPSGEQVVTATVDGRLWLWDRRSGALSRHLSEVGTAVQELTISSDGRWFVARKREPRLHLFDVGTWTASPVELDSVVTACALDATSRRAAVGVADGRVALLDLETRAITWLTFTPPPATSEGLAAAISCVAFAADGQTLVAGTEERNVALWEVETGRRLGQIDVRAPGAPRPDDDYRRVLAVLPMPDHRWLVSTQAPRLMVWEPGRPLVDLRSTLLISRLALHPRGEIVAVGASTGLVSLQ
ncbi:MAG: hypothetical protein ABL982_21265, partial [Vicinamibacterales bacterium]